MEKDVDGGGSGKGIVEVEKDVDGFGGGEKCRWK